MPTLCTHYSHLKSRHKDLEDKFLAAGLAAEAADPGSFQPDLDSMAAFKLLFHAELETFLESKAKDSLTNLKLRASSGLQFQREFPCLLSLFFLLRQDVPAEIFQHSLIDELIQLMISRAEEKIRKNNGIKEEAFALLSVISGKTLDEVDSSLSASLNSYGKDRGEVAHNSVLRVRAINGPSAESANAKSIVVSLGVYFDVA